jgi:hypothetical protein
MRYPYAIPLPFSYALFLYRPYYYALNLYPTVHMPYSYALFQCPYASVP